MKTYRYDPVAAAEAGVERPARAVIRSYFPGASNFRQEVDPDSWTFDTPPRRIAIPDYFIDVTDGPAARRAHPVRDAYAKHTPTLPEQLRRAADLLEATKGMSAGLRRGEMLLEVASICEQCAEEIRGLLPVRNGVRAPTP